MSMDRDLEFLYEMGCLRFVQRTWKRFLNADFQNLAEHHLRVCWIAMTIARREGNVNTERIMKMALVHDLAESRTGDVDYLSRQYTTRDEELGIKDMLKDTSFEAELFDLWEEYEKRETIESKIVKDADNLDVDFEIREQSVKGLAITEMFAESRKVVRKSLFYTKSGQQMWDAIQKSNPHDWHRNGRNRLNAGDWKQI